MSATYDPNLSTERDFIRFLIGDTSAPFTLSDEEIDALILDSTYGESRARKYFVAADALTFLSLRWASSGKGITSKSVSRLSISYGNSTSAQEALDRKIKELRAIGNYYLSRVPRIMRVLGPRRQMILNRGRE